MSILRLSSGTPIEDVPGIVNITGATNVGTSRAFNNGAVDVAFTKGAIGGIPVSYTVTSSPSNLTTTGSSSPLRVTGLIGNSPYTFTATATSASGYVTPVSLPSASVLVSTIPNAPVFSAPTSVRGGRAYANGAIDVPLSCSSGGSPVLSYTVVSTPGSISVAGTSAVRITGLTGGTSYTFAATATNANGTSTSTTYSTGTVALTVPQAPTIGTITKVGTTVTVPFTAGSNGGTAVTKYTLSYIYDDGDPEYSGEAGEDSGTFTGTVSPITFKVPRAGFPYTFTLTATNAEGTSLSSAPVVKAL